MSNDTSRLKWKKHKYSSEQLELVGYAYVGWFYLSILISFLEGVTSLDMKKQEIKERFRLLFPLMTRSTRCRCLKIRALFLISVSRSIRLNDVEFEINGVLHPVFLHSLWPRKGVARKHLAFLYMRISQKEAEGLAIHNKVRACVRADDGDSRICRPITYNVLLRRYFAAHGPLLHNKDAGTVAFFRQTAGRSLVLTVRHANVTDRFLAKTKLRFAWFAALFPVSKPPIVVFEKNGLRYEESGRAVFEYLVDKGKTNVFFIVPKSRFTHIDPAYSMYFVEPHTLKHYYIFFRSKMFLGTEALSHALELRCQSLLVQKKIKSSHNSYIFLQHGVMYMVSLDSPQRVSFKKKNMPVNSKVVVSSDLEASHFKLLAGFEDADLIVSGLPKFDNSWAKPDASKILIMPTWRPWEFNLARCHPEKTKYYQMIERIVRAIPSELREYVVVAPHPLFSRASFAEGDSSEEVSYDEMLRDVKILITDYSSIAYDAFYRGASVIFYWEELDACMENYGQPTHLMIDEETAFGDVCRSPQEVQNAVTRTMNEGRSDEFETRYRRIVSFHDGRNTERLVDFLINDKGVL